MSDIDEARPGYLRCKECGGEYAADIGVCEDCMLAGIKAQETRQEVGWQFLTQLKQDELRLRLEDILAGSDGQDCLYCPRCLEAYRPGFDHCADCDVSLVDLGRLVELYKPRSLVPPEGYEVCARCGELVPDDAEVCDDCVLAEGGETRPAELEPEALEAIRGELAALVLKAERSDLLVCPMCAVEYRPGFEDCTDCLVPLVQPAEMLTLYNQIASGWSPETDPQGTSWVEVWDVEGQGESVVAWKLLAQRGVEGRISLRFRTRNGFGTPRFVLWVPEGRLELARDALKELEGERSLDEDDD